MADFNVEINDKIAPSIQQKLDAIAKSAGASSDAVEKLKRNIADAGGGAVDSLSKAADRATKSIRDEAAAVNKLQSELRALQNVGSRPIFNASQIQNIGFQLNDIFVSLASGQKPLTVFIQQGSQIGQVFSQAGVTAGQGLLGIGRILTSLITPASLLVGTFVAAGAAVFSFINQSAGISDLSKRLGISKTEADNLYKSLFRLTGLSQSEQRSELTSFGLNINRAARDPNKEDDLNKLFQQNGLSILDSTGKMKDFNTQIQQAVSLIQNAKTEFDAIDIGKLLGFSEEFTQSIFRANRGLGDLKNNANGALSPLEESAAKLDKVFSDLWRNFVINAKAAIFEAGKFLYDQFANFSIGNFIKDGPLGIPGKIRDGIIDGIKAIPGKLGTGSKSRESVLEEMKQRGSDSLIGPSFEDRFNDTMRGNNNTAALREGLLKKADEINKKLDKAEEKTILPTKKNTVIPAPDKKEEKTKRPRLDVEEDINIKLDQQIERLKMLKPEREIQQALDEAQNRLRRDGKKLSDEEIAGIRSKIVEIERLKGVQREMDALYEQTAGTLSRYNDTQEAANNLLAKGVINQEQYASAVNKAKIRVLDSQNTISGGLESGLLKTVQEYGETSNNVSQTVMRSFDGLADGLSGFVSGTKTSFSDLSKSILSDVSRMIVRVAILKPLLSSLTGGFGSLGSIFGGGGPDGSLGSIGGLPVQGPTLPGSSGLAGILGGLFGFANGGEFKVGGSGGTDSQMVAFKASPDETVRITRPGQYDDGNKVNVTVNNNGNGQASVRDTRGSDGSRNIEVLIEQVENAIAGNISKGQGSLATSVQQRYGLNPAFGAR